MKIMKLHENSWHCQVYLAAYPRPLPEDFCSYFWKVIAAFVMLPFLVPYLFMGRLEELCDTRGPRIWGLRTPLGERLAEAALVWAWGVIVPFGLGMVLNSNADLPLWLQFVPWLTGAGILAVGIGVLFVGVALSEHLSERRRLATPRAKVETEGFFSAKIRSVKGRYCPRIDWVNETE